MLSHFGTTAGVTGPAHSPHTKGRLSLPAPGSGDNGSRTSSPASTNAPSPAQNAPRPKHAQSGPLPSSISGRGGSTGGAGRSNGSAAASMFPQQQQQQQQQQQSSRQTQYGPKRSSPHTSTTSGIAGGSIRSNRGAGGGTGATMPPSSYRTPYNTNLKENGKGSNRSSAPSAQHQSKRHVYSKQSQSVKTSGRTLESFQRLQHQSRRPHKHRNQQSPASSSPLSTSGHTVQPHQHHQPQTQQARAGTGGPIGGVNRR